MNLFIRWANRKRGLLPKIPPFNPYGSLVFLPPYALLVWLPRLDARLRLPSFSFGLVNDIIGGVFILLEMVYASWSISAQLFKAHGTPAR